MEHHRDQRADSDGWKADSVNIVGYLHGPCKLKERFSEELIQQACGILEINAFEGKSANGHKLRCIYPKMAILAHSCVPNTTHSILPRNDYKYVLIVLIEWICSILTRFYFIHFSDSSFVHQSILKKAKRSIPHTHSLPSELVPDKNTWKQERTSHANVLDVSIQLSWIRISAHWCARSVPAALSFQRIHWVSDVNVIHQFYPI